MNAFKNFGWNNQRNTTIYKGFRKVNVLFQSLIEKFILICR
jgi:hypothetical protein